MAERFDGVEYCTFFMGNLLLPVDRSWRVIPQNDRQSANIIICKLESIPIQFGILVAWKPEKICNFENLQIFEPFVSLMTAENKETLTK